MYCKEFAEIYYEGVSGEELEKECLHFTEYLKMAQLSEIEGTNNILGIYHLLKDNKIEDAFPNLEIAIKNIFKHDGK